MIELSTTIDINDPIEEVFAFLALLPEHAAVELPLHQRRFPKAGNTCSTRANVYDSSTFRLPCFPSGAIQQERVRLR